MILTLISSSLSLSHLHPDEGSNPHPPSGGSCGHVYISCAPDHHQGVKNERGTIDYWNQCLFFSSTYQFQSKVTEQIETSWNNKGDY